MLLTSSLDINFIILLLFETRLVILDRHLCLCHLYGEVPINPLRSKTLRREILEKVTKVKYAVDILFSCQDFKTTLHSIFRKLCKKCFVFYLHLFYMVRSYGHKVLQLSCIVFVLVKLLLLFQHNPIN